ncbi:MAG: Secretion protein HlyD [Bacteroidetes bacterium]|jgi:RND family efflux transporter MFP subunit|nr:Secretion protein HlyD [Bacteroidota bacterium]
MSTSTEQADLSALRINRHQRETPGGRRRPWKIIIPTGVVLIGLIGYMVIRPSLAGMQEVELVTATLTSPAQANAVLTANGYVVAQIKAAVASKGTGRLEFLGVEEGDRVKKGTIIARLEEQDVLAALRQAEANLGVAQADYQDAKLTLERQQRLHASNLSSQAELDAAQARFARVEATIRYAQATVTAAEVALENTRIRAPFDGTVLTKYADVGEVVAPFASSANSRGAVVTMADMNSLQVEADVSESNIIRVRPGQPCEITLDAYPEKRYPGVVHKIIPTADRAKATVLTKVAFRSKDERVLPEMSAKVMFLSDEPGESSTANLPVLTVPLSAVTKRNDQHMVLTVQDDRIVESPVSPGETLGERIVIREGIAAGEKVVARPEPGLTAGTKVRVRAQ